MIVYLVTNLLNGKKYVGQTARSLDVRWSEHCRGKSRTSAVYSAICKYGKDNFKIELLAEADSLEELNQLEIHYIDKHNTLSPCGYNLNTGGLNAFPSDETRAKMSVAQTGKKHTPEQIEKIRLGNKGKFVSDETKRKISLGNKGKVRSEEFRRNRAEFQTGYKASEETKLKMSESRKRFLKNLDSDKHNKLVETMSNISKDTAIKIKDLLRTHKTKEIAELLGVKPHIITDIKRGKTWRNV